jgi:hypothetical protein
MNNAMDADIVQVISGYKLESHLLIMFYIEWTLKFGADTSMNAIVCN